MQEVTLNNKIFEIPEPGEAPKYADDLFAYLIELSRVLNNIQGPLDLLEHTFLFQNNQSSPADVVALSFTSTEVVKFIADYLIIRTAGATVITEEGQLIGLQSDNGWKLSRGFVLSDSPQDDGYAGIEFTITSTGQVQYTSTNLIGQTEGKIIFTAKVLENS